MAAGGEVDFFPRLVMGDLAPFPAAMKTVTAEKLSQIADWHRRYYARMFPNAKSFTDPMLEAAARKHGFALDWKHFDWSCDRFLKSGEFMPKDGIEQLRGFDAIYLGAVGWPGVPDHISLWGLLIPIRRGFQQYVNLRPVRLFHGLKSPLADRKPGDIDYYIVRENNEGEYSAVGGRSFEGTELEQAVQVAMFTKKGCDRVMRYAFNLAVSRKRKEVASATKSNGISISMPYWDERFAAIGKEYPQVKTSQFHIDILCAHLVRNPTWFDVIVGSNLFGDILSDLAAGLVGGLGLAPGANIGTEAAIFEAVHGSAPDIAGKGIANPCALLLAAGQMLEHLGMADKATRLREAIRATMIAKDRVTPDLGGSGNTASFADAITSRL